MHAWITPFLYWFHASSVKKLNAITAQRLDMHVRGTLSRTRSSWCSMKDANMVFYTNSEEKRRGKSSHAPLVQQGSIHCASARSFQVRIRERVRERAVQAWTRRSGTFALHMKACLPYTHGCMCQIFFSFWRHKHGPKSTKTPWLNYARRHGVKGTKKHSMTQS